MKKITKIISVIILIIIISSASVYGFSVDDMTGEGINTSTDQKIDNIGQDIINIIQTIGSIVSVVILIAIGIKYMMGSTEERAQYKKSLLPYIIGAICLFGASNIASIIYNIAIDL